MLAAFSDYIGPVQIIAIIVLIALIIFWFRYRKRQY